MSTTRTTKIVAIDGPAGSGKSSICAAVCERHGWTYVNTGALYRAVGWLAVQRQVDFQDETACGGLVDVLAETMRWDGRAQTLIVDGQDITGLLGGEEVGQAASAVAKLPSVRDRLLPLQRELSLNASAPGALVDGRDIGTVVFPDADLKVFLTASLEERARRRLAQLGEPADDQQRQGMLEDLMAEMRGRDAQDAGRAAAPMKQAGDAVVLDTSQMTRDQVIERLSELLIEAGLV